MGRCFVIQPFDGGPFDKRYDDVLVPAIEEANLEPYRVDRDPCVSIPIDQIEDGIRNADICLANITENNPNVWFELGFAIAVPKEVVLICSETRTTNFPFDVQHRNIIPYKTQSPSDFEELKKNISARLRAAIEKKTKLGALSRFSPVADMEGLAQHEIVALATIMQNSFTPNESVSPYKIKEDMNAVGFTDIAVNLALRALLTKKMIEIVRKTGQGFYGEEEYDAYLITEKGNKWLVDNQDKLSLKIQNHEESKRSDIPF
ncbi:MAG TPA: hypothetical protein VIH42_00510 [Thermoguttaceae bacterium]